MSHGGFSGIVVGALSGTFGFAPATNRVLLSLARASRRTCVDVGSDNVNVPGSGLRAVFRHFCRAPTSPDSHGVNANVNLSLAHSLMRLRCNAVSTHGGRNRGKDGFRRKDRFVVHVPLNGSRLGPRRVVRRRRVGGRRGGRLTRTRRRRRLTRGGSRPTRVLGGSSAAPTSTGKTGTRVIVIRSRRSVRRCLGTRLSDSFGVHACPGKGITLGRVLGGGPSLIVDSVVVPRVSKAALYTGLGSGVGAGSIPVVLLATGDERRSRLRKLRANTSTCVLGPFGVSVLRHGVVGLLAIHHALHGGFANGRDRGRRMRRVRVRAPSGSLVRQIVRIVGRGVGSSSLDISVVTRGINVDHMRLRHGVGRLAGRAPRDFVHGVQLRRTTGLLGSNGRDVARIVCTYNFSGSTDFDAVFGGLCNYSPERCVRGTVGGWE